MSLVMHKFIRSRDQVVVKRVLTCKHGVVSSLTSLKTPTHNSTRRFPTHQVQIKYCELFQVEG